MAERERSPDHPDYTGDDPTYRHGSEPGEGAWATAERLGTVAPVMGNPSLDPAAGSLVQVSYMCGYGSDAGHDACEGVDRLVTEEVDATRQMLVESATARPPLALAPDDSVFYDDTGAISKLFSQRQFK